VRNCCRCRSHGVQARRLTSAGHDVDTVGEEGLSGVPDPDVVAAAAAAGRVLISLHVGLADIRAYPPGSHAGIVVVRLTDQSATAVSKAVGDLAGFTHVRLAGLRVDAAPE
jgi:hypothetical protein